MVILVYLIPQPECRLDLGFTAAHGHDSYEDAYSKLEEGSDKRMTDVTHRLLISASDSAISVPSVQHKASDKPSWAIFA